VTQRREQLMKKIEKAEDELETKGVFWNLIRRIDEVSVKSEEQFKLLQESIAKLRETVNNGVLDEASENRKSIEKLTQEVRQIQKILNHRKGQRDTLKLVTTAIISAITGAVGIVSILAYLGVI